MGTHGTYGVVIDGDIKVTYNGYDSYPDGLGFDILSVAHKIASAPPADTLALARNIRVVEEDAIVPPEDVERFKKFVNTNVGGVLKEDGSIDRSLGWYQVLREMQGRLDLNLSEGVMVDSSDFPLDGLFCEWGYIINFDGENPELQVYEGFHSKKNGKGGLWDDKQGRNGYVPIQLIASFPLSDLPDHDTFHSVVNKACRCPDEDDD